MIVHLWLIKASALLLMIDPIEKEQLVNAYCRMSVNKEQSASPTRDQFFFLLEIFF
jgi:hypothetical protein